MDHRDHVGQRQRLGLVVGDIDEGDAGAALQLLQLAAHVLAELGVEIGQRLVEQQDFRLDHEAPRQRHALLLAARQLVGIALLEAGQVHLRQDVRDLPLRLGRRHLADLQAEHDVLVHRLVRPHRVVLEHHAHAALVRRHHAARRGDQPAVDVDRTGIRHDISRNHPQRRRLAAAARPEQRDERVVGDFETEIGHRRRRVVAGAEALGQVLERDTRHYAVRSIPSRGASGATA